MRQVKCVICRECEKSYGAQVGILRNEREIIKIGKVPVKFRN